MFDSINLFDVLAEPTQIRTEVTEFDEGDIFEDDHSENLTFDDEPETIEQEEEIEVVQEQPYTEAEAKANAEILVDLIDTVNVATMTPLARWKLRKKRGGKDAIRKMQLIQEKQFANQKLSEGDKRLLFQYNAYLKDKEEMEQAIPYSNEEKERLIRSATSYLKNKKIRISGDLSFWGELAMIQGTRLMQILTA